LLFTPGSFVLPPVSKMRKELRRRVIIILAITAIGIYLVFFPHDRRPRLRDLTSWSQIKANIAENIKLGLDLKGGSHLVLWVQTDDAIRTITDNNVLEAEKILKKEGIPFKSVKATGLGQITVEVSDGSRNPDIEEKLRDDFGPGWERTRSDGGAVVFTMKESEMNDIRRTATNQAKTIIENRVNAFGVAEPTIQLHGREQDHQILLQLPGIDDPERVKRTLNAESRLELKEVFGDPHPTKEAAEAARAGDPNKMVIPLKERADAETGQPASTSYIVVAKTPVVSGIDLRGADAVPSQYGGHEYKINFQLKPNGAAKFEQFTSANIGKRLAIVLNDEAKSAPTIQAAISDRGEITGAFTKESAEDLALVLRSGALPAKVVYLEERTVGPSLGADSIRQGVIASIVGLVLVVLCMLIYYRGAGVNATLALIVNLVLLLAGLAMLGAVLTLPGIAGVILTIGMAVDSNVLIFERIREEIRNGKVIVSAVDTGFKRAFLTIIDTHVTTIVSAAFLFVFGTGPIRGFAVTLAIGLIANLFASVYVSRTIFNFILTRSGQRVESLSI